jgi:pimeloyl-ACP methyl ester carboxylesterase
MATHDWRHILEAGSAIGNFNSLDWLPGVDVPTSVVLTTQDTVVPLERQQRLIESIPGAQSFEVGAGHNAVYAQHEAYVPVLLEACLSVHHRSVA